MESPRSVVIGRVGGVRVACGRSGLNLRRLVVSQGRVKRFLILLLLAMATCPSRSATFEKPPTKEEVKRVENEVVSIVRRLNSKVAIEEALKKIGAHLVVGIAPREEEWTLGGINLYIGETDSIGVTFKVRYGSDGKVVWSQIDSGASCILRFQR